MVGVVWQVLCLLLGHGLLNSCFGSDSCHSHALPCLQVFEALRALGLHSTAAGRQAIAAAQPARPLRADTLNSAQKQGMRQGMRL